MDEFQLRHIAKDLFLPPAGPLILVFVGLLMAWRRKRLALTLIAVGAGSLWLLSTPIVSGELVRWGQYSQALDFSRPIAAQAVVILASGAREDIGEYQGPAPAERTLQRLVYGARVARATKLPVLVTGGDIESIAMTDMLRRDFDLTSRWIESAATNTQENAEFSCPLLKAAGVHTIVLVTSALHMRRAAAEFRSQGMDVIAAPVDVRGRGEIEPNDFVPAVAALQDSRYVLYEAAGRLVQSISRR
jgi:uncharacterized SAM-binding protein YcdF (DUF218 family)